MSDFVVGLNDLLKSFDSLTPQIKAAQQVGLKKAVLKVHDAAVQYAPRSPMQKQKNALRKTKRDTSNMKKPTATTRTKPGALKRSISFDVGDGQATVFVAENAECRSVSKNGKVFNYAKKIHNEKGVSWHNRGPGTVALGAKADDKFIERAIKDNEQVVHKILENELNKVHL